MIKHGAADAELDVAFGRHHLPRQRECSVAVGKRHAQHLGCLLPDEAAVEHDGGVASGPRLKHLGDNRRTQAPILNPRAQEPATNAHDPASGFGISRKGGGDLTRVD